MCLQSLVNLPHLPSEIETLIVDNDSSDGTREFLQAIAPKFKRIRLKTIFNSRNIGLSRATAQAYENSIGEWVLLCNPDIAFDGTFHDLLSYVFSHPQEMVTPELLNMDGSRQRVVHRRFPTVTRVFFDFGLLGSYIDEKLMDHRVRKSYAYQDEELPSIAPIDQPGASFLLFSRPTVQRIGYIFDPQFPVWWNDVDLAKRAEKAGIPRTLLSNVRMRHVLGHSQKKDLRSPQRYLFCRSMIHYARKWSMHPYLMQVLFTLDAILSVPLFTFVQSRTRGPMTVLKRSISFAAAQVAGVLGI